MPRSLLIRLMVAGLAASAGACRSAGAADDPRFAAGFLQGLRDKGYDDLAIEYLDALRKSPDAPEAMRRTFDFDEGRILIESASRLSNPEEVKARLDKARAKVEGFIKQHPDDPDTADAYTALGMLFYERGRTETGLAGDEKTPADKEARLRAARGEFARARDAYDKGVERLSARYNSFSKFIPAEDPRKDERDRAKYAMILAELRREVVSYEEAETYPPDSKTRQEMLDKEVVAFGDVYNRYRSEMPGLSARMWQGKCFEEQGKLGEAMGIYKELLDHPDPLLRPLQRRVAYFRIIVMGKRGEHALAADECNRWLAAFPGDRRSFEALGVRFELAKDILAQLPKLTDAERPRAVRAATDHLADVVQVVSPFKPDALALLQKYRPRAALAASDAAKFTYDEALTEASQAVSLQEYDKAIALLIAAGRKVDASKESAKANKARYLLGYAYYMAGRYYESAVSTEHVARTSPNDEWGPRSAGLAIAAMFDGYNAYTIGDRSGDLDRVADFARYVVDTFPATEQGDTARMAVGQVALIRSDVGRAIEAFDSVRADSPQAGLSLSYSGDAHWKQSVALREKGDDAGADAEASKAREKLQASLKSQKERNVEEVDPRYVDVAAQLAAIDVAVDKPKEAVGLLSPIADKLVKDPVRSKQAMTGRVVTGLLRAHVADGQVDKAMADMKNLEATGGAGQNGAQLYFELGRLLERETEVLKRRNDRAGLRRTEEAYRKFLGALVATKSGQSFGSMKWAADNLLKLGAAGEASTVYDGILKAYGQDPEFLKTQGAQDQLLLVNIKQAAALRALGKLNDAEVALNAIIKARPGLLEPQVEKGFLLNAKAEAKVGSWADASNYWKALAVKLSSANPKPIDYFEAWYQMAQGLQKQGKEAQARQALASVMRLSPAVGSPEMKARFQSILGKPGK